MTILENIEKNIEKISPSLDITEDEKKKLFSHKSIQKAKLKLNEKEYDAWRIIHNNSLGPGKGGIRFHPNVSEDEVKDMNEPLIGNFEGIGIQFNVLYDTILVISPVPGGPSEKVGIRAGDRIVKIDGENVAGIGITTTKVKDRLLGEKGTKVNVGIKRKGIKELIEFTITRDKIPIHSLDAAYMADDEVGYIKLNRFSFTTMKEFHIAVDSLLDQE